MAHRSFIPNLSSISRWTIVSAIAWFAIQAIGFAGTDGKSTVFMVAMDGLRPDYIDRAETPFLDLLLEQAAWSRELVPTFPTNTFQSFSSIATGLRARQHGITGNSFYDTRTQRIHRYPGDSALLEAEPIWRTAERQGVRTLVFDWVLSHNQSGPAATSYHGNEYTRGISDRERMKRVLRAWRADDDARPLRFILAYAESPDSEGHRYGPDSPAMEEVMAHVDTLLASVYSEAREIWSTTASTGDSFYFVVLSDHGMSSVETVVNLRNAAQLEGRDAVVSMTTGNIGHLFFNRLRSEERRRQWILDARDALDQHAFISVYERDELPADWDYAHPYRTGDLIAVLPTGYTFSARPEGVTEAVENFGGPFGMHGYDPAEDPNMNTLLVVHRHPKPLAGGDIGRVSTLQIHPTVARILGIDPAPRAKAKPLELK